MHNFCGNTLPQYAGYFCIFQKKLLKVNNHSMGEFAQSGHPETEQLSKGE
jgi:hypothetical protein